LAEFGVVAKIGREGVDELLLMVRDGDERVPELAQAYILALAEQLVLLKRQILEMEPAHHCLPPGQRGQRSLGRDSRRRAAARQCSGG
jgi:hypothetical protein